MKRLIVLLILLAGGLTAAAFIVPSDAASVNGVSISKQQLNSDLDAIAGSADYRCFLSAEQAVATGGATPLPSVDGTAPIGDGTSRQTVTTGFASYYLETAIGHQLVLGLAAQRHVTVTPRELAAACTEYEGQISGILTDVAQSKYTCGTAVTAQDVLSSMPSSFVDRTVKFDATVSVLEEDLSGVGSTPADLQRYFDNHAAQFDTACLTVAGYSTEAEAQAAAATVAAGTPFATVAAQTQGGGPQKCEILYGIAASLPAGSDLESLPLNTVSNPISDNSAYFLVEITKRTPTSFAKAMTAVENAVQAAGASKTSTFISTAQKSAHISVDPRYGKWAATRVVPPVSPPTADLLNRSVDGKVTKTTASAGQSS